MHLLWCYLYSICLLITVGTYIYIMSVVSFIRLASLGSNPGALFVCLSCLLAYLQRLLAARMTKCNSLMNTHIVVAWLVDRQQTIGNLISHRRKCRCVIMQSSLRLWVPSFIRQTRCGLIPQALPLIYFVMFVSFVHSYSLIYCAPHVVSVFRDNVKQTVFSFILCAW